jgi:hypothetical protein|tara:strand:- start:524 stop:700 length:177 start_codon:yes stop_codon:yes gene_type:complete
MRRGLNPQIPEYVQDGELICFGVSDHVIQEAQPIWTDKAVKDLNIVSSFIDLITAILL